MTSISDLISRFIKALIAALFGGAREAGSLIAQDARQIGRAVRSVGEATARVVGRGLSGPARIIDGLANATGSLLPSGPVGPKAVADAAVEADNHNSYVMPAETVAALNKAAMAGDAVKFAASARAEGKADLAKAWIADLPPHVGAWVDGLTARQVAHLASLDCWAIAAHVEGRNLAAGLPPVPAAPAPITDREQMQKALAEIRRIARAERAETVALATGEGPRPAVLPTQDDDYVPTRGASAGPRPAFH